jgi:tetratricopeptide (TPR) repeat protein
LLLCATAPFARAQTAADGTGDTPFKTYVRSANAARDAGNIDAALQNYREALKMDATWQEGWWNLGTLLYERDRYADAIPAFQTLAGLAPQASPAWTFLGLCEFETKDYANALEHLFKGEALGGVEDAEIARVAKYHLGLLLIRAGEFDRAHAVLAGLASAGQSSPQITFALGLGLLRVPLLPEEVDPSREALVLDTGGVAAQVAAGDGPGALTAFQTAIAKYPDAPYLHYAYGEALAADGKLEDALGEFRRELGISPQSALPQVEIARVELGLKRANEALLAAQEAVRRAPDSHAAHEVLAQCFAATGARREAAKELMAAETLGGEKPSMEERIVERYRTNVAERGTSRQGLFREAIFRGNCGAEDLAATKCEFRNGLGGAGFERVCAARL